MSVIPSEISRFKFTVGWLCADRIAADTFVVKGFRQRTMTAPSPRCQRTIVFKDWRYIDFLPRVGWRFADGDGYRSKEPINVSVVPFPIFFAQRFPVWKRRTPLLYMFRWCGSPVSWVRLFGASALALFAPNRVNKRRETSSIAYWRISRSWMSFLTFLNNWISPKKPIWATSAYNLGKYGNSPVGCRPKEG
jgi:hypothetical protein